MAFLIIMPTSGVLQMLHKQLDSRLEAECRSENEDTAFSRLRMVHGTIPT